MGYGEWGLPSVHSTSSLPRLHFHSLPLLHVPPQVPFGPGWSWAWSDMGQLQGTSHRGHPCCPLLSNPCHIGSVQVNIQALGLGNVPHFKHVHKSGESNVLPHQSSSSGLGERQKPAGLILSTLHVEIRPDQSVLVQFTHLLTNCLYLPSTWSV